MPALSNPSPAGAEPVAGAYLEECRAKILLLPGSPHFAKVGPFYVGQQDFVKDLALIATSSSYAVDNINTLYPFLNKSMWITRTSR